jgi:hypothetical protein
MFAVLPDGEVSLEVVSTTAEDMVREARTLLTWAPKVQATPTPMKVSVAPLQHLHELGRLCPSRQA